jgi:hypothetical protein
VNGGVPRLLWIVFFNFLIFDCVVVFLLLSNVCSFLLFSCLFVYFALLL